MAKKGNDSPQIITANRLDDGIVVYFATDKDAVQWVEKIADASVLIGEALTAALSRAEQAVEANEVVEVYPIPVDEAKHPQSQREAVRAAGPTIAYGVQ
ncbi:MAG TPA: DUF2849 domain-containing protein [Alphaproteobacteria bacterium]|nr:DUF2849 domain-containing protein [Alphaproteobacteria bacterium]